MCNYHFMRISSPLIVRPSSFSFNARWVFKRTLFLEKPAQVKGKVKDRQHQHNKMFWLFNVIRRVVQRPAPCVILEFFTAGASNELRDRLRISVNGSSLRGERYIRSLGRT